MYGIFTTICPKNHPNVGKYTTHGAYGIVFTRFPADFPSTSSGRGNESESNAFWEPIEAWLHSS